MFVPALFARKGPQELGRFTTQGLAAYIRSYDADCVKYFNQETPGGLFVAPRV